MELMDAVKLGILISAVVIIYIILDGWSKNCPDCGKWWVRQVMGKEKIGEENSFKTIKRTRTIRDSDGKVIRTEEYDEQVPIILREFRNYNQCSFCGYKWTTTSKYEK